MPETLSQWPSSRRSGVAAAGSTPSRPPPAAAALVRARGFGQARSYNGGASDRKSTRLNSRHGYISYALFCLEKKKKDRQTTVPCRTTVTSTSVLTCNSEHI